MAGKSGSSAGDFLKSSIKDLRSLKWADAAKKSLAFCVNPRRFLPFFIADLAAVSLALLMAGNLTTDLIGYAMGSYSPEMVTTMGGLGVVFVAWFLVMLWISGSLVHQSWKGKEYEKSWSVSLKRYPVLFAVVLVTGIVTFLLSYIPVAGTLLMLVSTLAFMLVYPYVIIRGSGFTESISGSARTFGKRPASVFFLWAVNSVITMLIILIFALPLVSTYMSFALQYGADDGLIFMLMYMDRTLLYAEGAVLLLGMAISRTFSLKLITEIYLQMNRKKFLIF